MKHFITDKKAGLEVMGTFGARTTRESKSEKTDDIPEETPPVIEDKPVIDKAPVIKKGAVFGCELVNLRKAPNFDAPVLAILRRDEEFDILSGGTKEFASVDHNGTVGYIARDYVKEV